MGMTLKKIALPLMYPGKRALNDAEDDSSLKRPRTRDFQAGIEDEGDNPHRHTQGTHQPPGPMRTNPRIAQQAQSTLGPSHLDSQHCRREVTSWISTPWINENSAAGADSERSTLGWDENTNLRSERAFGASQITTHFSGSAESHRDSACTLINPTRVGTSEVRISRLYQERGNFDSSSSEGIKSKGKEQEEFANPPSTNSTHPTTFNGANKSWAGQSVLLRSSLYFEDAPTPAIPRSLRHRNQQDVPHVNSWYGNPIIGGGSSPSESTSYPLWGLNDDELDASLDRLEEYFIANPHLLLTPADIAALPTSFSSTFGVCAAPHQHKGTADITRGYSQLVHLDTTSPLSSPTSPSPSLASDAWLPLSVITADTNASCSLAPSSNGMSSSSSLSSEGMSPSWSMHIWNHLDPLLESMQYGAVSSSSSSSPPSPASSKSKARSHPVHPARAPMGAVSQATVLWLMRSVPPALVSSLIHQALSLTDPETQLSILVLRELWGRHLVTADEVNEFEAMVYNDTMDERRRGRRQRKPRRRSHN